MRSSNCCGNSWGPFHKTQRRKQHRSLVTTLCKTGELLLTTMPLEHNKLHAFTVGAPKHTTASTCRITTDACALSAHRVETYGAEPVDGSNVGWLHSKKRAQAESQQLSALVSTPDLAGLKNLFRGVALTAADSLAVLTPLRAPANSLLSVRERRRCD